MYTGILYVRWHCSQPSVGYNGGPVRIRYDTPLCPVCGQDHVALKSTDQRRYAMLAGSGGNPGETGRLPWVVDMVVYTLSGMRTRSLFILWKRGCGDGF